MTPGLPILAEDRKGTLLHCQLMISGGKMESFPEIHRDACIGARALGIRQGSTCLRLPTAVYT